MTDGKKDLLADRARKGNMGKLRDLLIRVPDRFYPEALAFSRRIQAEILKSGKVHGVTPGTKSGDRAEAILELLQAEDRPMRVPQIIRSLEAPEYWEAMCWQHCSEDARLTYVRRALAGLIATGRVRRDGRQFTALTNNSPPPA